MGFFAVQLLTFLCSTATAIAVENQNIPAISQDAKINFALPINWTEQDKLDLFVMIPEGFRSIQSFEDMMKETTPLIEFIPKDQNSDNWSEIITINKFIGKSLAADYVTAFLKRSILSKTPSSKVWKDTRSDEKNYLQANIGLIYNHQGSHEVMGAQYYSGPSDCVGVQYTIRVKSGTDTDAMHRIEDFFKDNVRVVKSSKM